MKTQIDRNVQHRKIKGRECSKCGKVKRTRHIIWYKGKYFCTECLNKEEGLKKHYFPNPTIKIEEALERVYYIRATVKLGKYAYCYCYFPKILAGKKVKLKLIK